VRERRVDLARELGDLLGQLLVLARELRVRVEQRDEPVRLGLDRRDPFRSPLLGLVVPLLGQVVGPLVALGLPRLGEQDQRCRTPPGVRKRG